MAFNKKYMFMVVMIVIVMMTQITVLGVYLMSKKTSLVSLIVSFVYTEGYRNERYNSSHINVSFKGNAPIEENMTYDNGYRWLVPTKSEVFQPVDGKEAWLYSAFYDHVAAEKGKPLVRVFGVVRKTLVLKVFCNISSNGTTLASTGVVIELPGHFGKLDRPAFLECPLPSNARPTHVSVSFQKTDKPTNRLQILYPGPRIRNFTVCYSVLHSGYKMITQLIESIEMNRILGADHFMVYNYSISPAVDQILRRYQEDGLVTVLQWQLPTVSSHYYSQLTSLNDCSYRNRNTSRFVVVMDTDELIIPRSDYTWMEFIDRASPEEIDVSQFTNSSQKAKSRNKVTACFMVRSSIFPVNSTPNWDSLPSQLQFGEGEKKNITKHNIRTLSQMRRQQKIYPYYDRCKYIARPELVYISGIHYVMAFTNAGKCFHVDPNVALVHHYRKEMIGSDFVNDTSILRFKDNLYNRMMEQIRRFPNIF